MSDVNEWLAVGGRGCVVDVSLMSGGYSSGHEYAWISAFN